MRMVKEAADLEQVQEIGIVAGDAQANTPSAGHQWTLQQPPPPPQQQQQQQSMQSTGTGHSMSVPASATSNCNPVSQELPRTAQSASLGASSESAVRWQPSLHLVMAGGPSATGKTWADIASRRRDRSILSDSHARNKEGARRRMVTIAEGPPSVVGEAPPSNQKPRTDPQGDAQMRDIGKIDQLSRNKRAALVIASRRKNLDSRLNLFMNVRILMKILEREDPKLRLQAAKAVEYCSRKHKEGDREFKSLAKSIDQMLRVIVGEKRWKMAEDCQRRIILSKQKKKPLPKH